MCQIIQGDDFSAISCGAKPTDHICNEDGMMYELTYGERHFFKERVEADKFFDENCDRIHSASVCCSICGQAEIDKAIRMEY